MIVTGHCTTELEGYDVSIVKTFVAVPIIGKERVSCLKDGEYTELTVLGVAHYEHEGQPKISVELG
jgi:hypothetical protein